MKPPFNPDAPFEEYKPAFDPNAPFEAEELQSEIPQAPASKTESLLRGIAQGGSFGLADELTSAVQNPIGAASQVANLLGADIQTPSVESYKAERDLSRANYAAAEQENPMTSLAGNVIGGVGQTLAAAPLAGLNVLKGLVGGGQALSTGQKLLQAGKLGTVLGAAGGLGSSTGETGLDVAKDIGFGAGAGLLTGTALTGAGIAGSKALSGISNAAKEYGIGRKILKGFETGKAGTNLFKDKTRDRIEKFGEKTAGNFRDELVSTQNKIGAAKTNLLQAAEDAGARVNISDDIAAARFDIDGLRSDRNGMADKALIADKLRSFEEDLGISHLSDLSPTQIPKVINALREYSTVGERSLQTNEGTQIINNLIKSLNEKARLAVPDSIIEKLDDPLVKSIVQSNPKGSALESVDSAYSMLKSAQDMLSQSTDKTLSGASGETEQLRKLLSRLEQDTEGGTSARLLLDQVTELMGKISPDLKKAGTGAIAQAKQAAEMSDLSKTIRGAKHSYGLLGKLAGGGSVATSHLAGLSLNVPSNTLKYIGRTIDKATSIHGAESMITKALQKISDMADEGKQRAMMNVLMQNSYYRTKLKELAEPEDG